VSSTLPVGVTAIVTRVLRAAASRSKAGVVNRDVTVVVDPGGTASTDQTATTIAGASVNDSAVGVGIRLGAQAAIAGKDARLVGEVAAVSDATRGRVGERALGQPTARSRDLASVFHATGTISVSFAAGGFAADTRVHVVSQIPDASTGRATSAFNELVQRAADGLTGASKKGKRAIVRALTAEVKLSSVVRSSSVAGMAFDAGTFIVDDVARMGRLAARETRQTGFPVDRAALLASFAAGSAEVVRRRSVVSRDWHPRGEHARGGTTTAEHLRPAALHVVANDVTWLERLRWQLDVGLGDRRKGDDAEYLSNFHSVERTRLREA